MSNPIKIGIRGPVGAGKTQLIEKVVKRLAKEMVLALLLMISILKKMKNTS